MSFDKIALIILSFSVSTLCFAFFCPTNFTQIEYGATIAEVTAQCGKPNKIETKDIKKVGPQEWNYFIPQTVATDALNPMQGTVKTQITFDSTGKIVNISVNGIGVGATSICGQNIELGYNKETVKKICGRPSFINSQNAGNLNSQKKDKMTIFTYQSTPPIKLTFINGILTKKE